MVLPRSSKSEIIGVYDDLLKVKISSPPVDGKANENCIKYFSKLFKIPRSNISIVKGDRSKKKKLKIVSADPNKITSIIRSYV